MNTGTSRHRSGATFKAFYFGKKSRTGWQGYTFWSCF